MRKNFSLDGVRYCLTIGQSKFAYKDNIFYVALYDATHKIQNGTTGCNAAFVDFIMNATDANVVKSVITLLKSKGQYTSTYNDYEDDNDSYLEDDDLSYSGYSPESKTVTFGKSKFNGFYPYCVSIRNNSDESNYYGITEKEFNKLKDASKKERLVIAENLVNLGNIRNFLYRTIKLSFNHSEDFFKKAVANLEGETLKEFVKSYSYLDN